MLSACIFLKGIEGFLQGWAIHLQDPTILLGMDALFGGAAGWWAAQKLPVLKTILDLCSANWMSWQGLKLNAYIASHDVFIICILTAKNKWYFSLSVHSFQLSVNAGHLGESKQISLHFFSPSYCILLPITSDISVGKVLVVMMPWRICMP